jgi:hypothetical protein
MLIAQATSVVQQRAFAQESADSIALAGAVGGTPSAQQLAALLGVTIMQMEIASDNVMVRVRSHGYIATAEATAGR